MSVLRYFDLIVPQQDLGIKSDFCLFGVLPIPRRKMCKSCPELKQASADSPGARENCGL